MTGKIETSEEMGEGFVHHFHKKKTYFFTYCQNDIFLIVGTIVKRPQKLLSDFFVWVAFVFVVCSFQDRVSCQGILFVDQSGLELIEICLPLPPECWDLRRGPLLPGSVCVFLR